MIRRDNHRHLLPPSSWRALAAAALCAALLLAGCSGGNGGTPVENADAEDTAVLVEIPFDEETDSLTDLSEDGADPAGDYADASTSAGVQTAAANAGTGETSSGSSAAADDPGDSASSAGNGSSAIASGDSASSAENGSSANDPAGSKGSSGNAGEVFSAEGKGLLIVLDPGHSSTVPETEEPIGPGSTEMKEADTIGTYGPSSGVHEYELTMRVSQKLRAELEKRGYSVRLTHLDTVRPISCSARAQVANENEADAFVRIHANASEDTSVKGAMTICITKDNPFHPELYSASYRLSEIVLDTYCEQTDTKREKIWETDTMTGNNWAEVPTTLIELGYMTNPDEDLKMNMDSSQKKMVKAIADGLDKWFAEMPDEELAMHPSLSGKPQKDAEEDAGSAATERENAASVQPVPADGENAASVQPAAADGENAASVQPAAADEEDPEGPAPEH